MHGEEASRARLLVVAVGNMRHVPRHFLSNSIGGELEGEVSVIVIGEGVVEVEGRELFVRHLDWATQAVIVHGRGE